MVQWILAGCYLAVCVKSDLKVKQISLRWSRGMLAAGILLRLPEIECWYVDSWRNFFGRLFFDALPGTACMLFSRLSSGKIGMGDGWMMLVTGIFLGAEKAIWIIWTAFFLGAGYSVILLLKGNPRHQEFAFAPCLFLAWLTAYLTL